MALAIGYDEKTNLIRFTGNRGGTTGSVTQIPFFGSPDNPDLPHANLNQRESPFYVLAGPTGLEALVLNFPRRQARTAVATFEIEHQIIQHTVSPWSHLFGVLMSFGFMCYGLTVRRSRAQYDSFVEVIYHEIAGIESGFAEDGAKK